MHELDLGRRELRRVTAGTAALTHSLQDRAKPIPGLSRRTSLVLGASPVAAEPGARWLLQLCSAEQGALRSSAGSWREAPSGCAVFPVAAWVCFVPSAFKENSQSLGCACGVVVANRDETSGEQGLLKKGGGIERHGEVFLIRVGGVLWIIWTLGV